ncbi:MAG: EVE domain-containing protein [Gemmataceae bacterium]
MALWLFKEEPTHYSYDDLVKDGSTLWNGIENALARKHLRQVKKGDRIFYYHTGKEKAVVAEMKALEDAKQDPESDDENAVAVKVGPVKRLTAPVQLSRIKADSAFAEWELVRMSRLSVMPVSPEIWKRIEAMSREKA